MCVQGAQGVAASPAGSDGDQAARCLRQHDPRAEVSFQPQQQQLLLLLPAAVLIFTTALHALRSSCTSCRQQQRKLQHLERLHHLGRSAALPAHQQLAQLHSRPVRIVLSGVDASCFQQQLCDVYSVSRQMDVWMGCRVELGVSTGRSSGFTITHALPNYLVD